MSARCAASFVLSPCRTKFNRRATRPITTKMISLKEIGEFGLIDDIKQLFNSKTASLALGIGDDCAVMKHGEGMVSLITTDVLAEGVHFDRNYFTPFQLGMKAAAVNISDIAAMGASPKYILTSLAIPKNIDYIFIKKFYNGIKKCCSRFGIELIGGDTSSSKQGLFISVTVIGEACDGEYITRSGANPGDMVYVTGTLGDSAGGLETLRQNPAIDENRREYLVKRHIETAPLVDEGLFLVASKAVTSMLDVSDGVGSDIKRICDESCVGAEILLNRLPVSKQLVSAFPHFNLRGLSVYDLALSGGEDYELMFTVKPEKAKSLEDKYKKRFKQKISPVGVITSGKKVVAISKSGEKKPITSGYNHFRKP